MAQVLIRNIDDEVIERLKTKAAANKQSLEQSLRELLSKAAKPDRKELVERMRQCRQLTRGRNLPDATDLIREDRDNDEPYR